MKNLKFNLQDKQQTTEQQNQREIFCTLYQARGENEKSGTKGAFLSYIKGNL